MGTIFLGVLMLLWMPLPGELLPGPAALYAAPLPSNGVVVYQFHRRFRCEACHTLEAAIREALKTHFAGELASGRIVYMVVDLDAEGSGRFEEKYDFFYNTVIMVDMENGEETRYKNLESVWDLVDDKGKVIDFIRSQIQEYL